MSREFLSFLIPALALAVPFMPLVVLLYWYTHVRHKLSSNRQVIRTKELSFFFMRTLQDQWRLGAHWVASWLPAVVMGLGAAVSAVSLITLLHSDPTTIRELLGFTPEGLEKYVRPVFFGFLGAYMFMLQTTLRRYLDDDLDIDTYIVVSVRMLTAFIVCFVGGFILPATLDTGLKVTLAVFVYGASFVFGVMPEQGFETILRIVGGWLGERFRGVDTHSDDLRQCLNLDRVRLARLDVENVKTVSDLAYVEIERLAQKTRYDLQSIFYWVDRAIFYSQLGESPLRQALESCGVNTFSAFEGVFRDSEARAYIEKQLTGAAGGGDSPARHVGLDVAFAAMQQIPNAGLVRLFMRYKTMQVAGAFEAANRAAALIRLGRYDQAVAEYNAALERNPLDPTLLTQRGRAQAMVAQQYMQKGLFAQGQSIFDLALHDLQRALDILPVSWEARWERARVLLMHKPYLFDRAAIDEKLSQAIADLEQARRHNDQELGIVNLLAQVYLEQGRPNCALSEMEKALAPRRYDALAHVRAAAGLLAARAAIACAQAEPSEHVVFLNAAWQHIGQARSLMPRSALLFLTEALYHHVANPGARQEERLLELALQPGEVRLSAPDVDVADPWFQAHVRVEQPDLVYEMWGDLCQDRREYDTALACFTQAIALNPARVSARMRRGALYARFGDLDAALADYEFLIRELDYQSPDVYMACARTRSLLSLHDPAQRRQAEHDLERAMAMSPHDPRPPIHWGDWLRLLERYGEALEAYKRAEELLQLSGDDAVWLDLWVGRSLAYSGLGDRRQARRALEQADQRAHGPSHRPPELWIGWGVWHGLEANRPESQMSAFDAFAHLADQPALATVDAADLKQMSETLQRIKGQMNTLDRAAQARLSIAQIRVAIWMGDSTERIVEWIDAWRSDVMTLSNEKQRNNLQTLWDGLQEFKRFV